MSPLYPVVTPTGVGAAALDELPRVPWRSLEMAYAYREQRSLAYDPEASLRALATDAKAAIHALYSNICHQGTVYEATAYAVPFLVAFASGADVRPKLRREIVQLLADIGLSSSFATEDGSFAGAFGEGVGEQIRAALVTARFDRIVAHDASVAAILAAVADLARGPSQAGFEHLRELYRELETRLSDEDEAPSPPPASEIEHYRHPKLGDAVLVRRQENGLLLRFEDGKERVILERFVTRVS